MSALQELIQRDEGIAVFDRYVDMLRELFVIEHPSLSVAESGSSKEFGEWLDKRRDKRGGFTLKGVWAYFPWRRQLVHLPYESEYYRLRTARNSFLVSPEEQLRLRDLKIGIIGLSVGQASALTLAISGIGRQPRLADPDVIEATNLNRLHAGVADIGISKAVVVGRLITELDPFLDPILLSSRITEGNIDDFLSKGGKLDTVVDAFDDVRMKIILRIVARKHRIPILMATDVADGAVLEIERYDLDPYVPMFGGRVKENQLRELPIKVDIKNFAQLATNMIGVQRPPERMLDSIRALGAKLAGYPQLGLASFLGGSLTTYAIKRIALGDTDLPPRIEISIDDLFH